MRMGRKFFSFGLFYFSYIVEKTWFKILSRFLKELSKRVVLYSLEIHQSFFKEYKIYITRPNCALYRSKILCLYVPGFRRQVLKYVSKCKWIPQTKLQWIPHTYTCNVNLVGTFVSLRIPQQAYIASCSGFLNCKWIPQNVSGIRKCKWIPQTVRGFRILFNTELAYEQLKAELEFLYLAMRKLKAKT